MKIKTTLIRLLALLFGVMVALAFPDVSAAQVDSLDDDLLAHLVLLGHIARGSVEDVAADLPACSGLNAVGSLADRVLLTHAGLASIVAPVCGETASTSEAYFFSWRDGKNEKGILRFVVVSGGGVDLVLTASYLSEEPIREYPTTWDLIDDKSKFVYRLIGIEPKQVRSLVPFWDERTSTIHMNETSFGHFFPKFARTIDTNNPLAVAIYWDRPEVVSMLIAHGADPCAPGMKLDGLDIAACRNLPELTAMMLKHGVDPNADPDVAARPLPAAIALSCTRSAMVIIESGHDLAYRFDDQSTLVHLAASHGHADIVQALVGLGLDPGSRNRTEATPYMRAAHGGHTNVMTYLDDLDPNLAAVVDEAGENAVFHATRGNSDIGLRYLVDRGHDLAATNGKGQKPLDVARANKLFISGEYLRWRGLRIAAILDVGVSNLAGVDPAGAFAAGVGLGYHLNEDLLLWADLKAAVHYTGNTGELDEYLKSKGTIISSRVNWSPARNFGSMGPTFGGGFYLSGGLEYRDMEISNASGRYWAYLFGIGIDGRRLNGMYWAVDVLRTMTATDDYLDKGARLGTWTMQFRIGY